MYFLDKPRVMSKDHVIKMIALGEINPTCVFYNSSIQGREKGHQIGHQSKYFLLLTSSLTNLHHIHRKNRD